MEVLCKAKSKARTGKLTVPEGVNMSFQWAVKGSYRQANMLSYLDKWLESWSEAREEAADYRVLMMDVA